jgi:diguanylate cyclase (GGDEF)-like protein/PAS domain S-box-containing protein
MEVNMKKTKYTYEQLWEKVKELEMLNNELLKEKEEETRLEYAWSGNLGHWYWNIKTNSVVFNPLKIMALGYSMEEVPKTVNYQFFTDRLHPEDYQRTMEAMLLHIQDKKSVYEAEYRIRAKDETWKWFYDRGKITQRDDSGKPVFVAGIVFDLSAQKEKEKELEKKNEILKHDSQTDALTGIKNRKTIMHELEGWVVESSINKAPLSIIMLDIDRFKILNDSKGHVFGDHVLKEVAGVISRSLRGLDTIGRYGGEEFIVILPKTAKENAISVAERIRTNVASYNFGEGVNVTISGGVKEYHGEELTELIDGADKKLYEAKNAGRNIVLA